MFLFFALWLQTCVTSHQLFTHFLFHECWLSLFTMHWLCSLLWLFCCWCNFSLSFSCGISWHEMSFLLMIFWCILLSTSSEAASRELCYDKHGNMFDWSTMFLWLEHYVKSFLSFSFPYPVHFQTFSSRNNVCGSCRLIQAVCAMFWGGFFLQCFWKRFLW